MKKVSQKILSILLCVCLVFSCLTVNAGAVFVEAAAVIAAIGSIMTVYDALSTLAGLYYEEPNIIMESIREDLYGRTSSFAWCVPGSRVNAASNRIEITQTALEMIAQDWNLNYSTAGFDFPCRLATIQGSDGRTYRVIQLMCMADAQDTSGRTKQAWFLGDGSGRLLCSVDAISAAGIWIPFQKLSSVYNLVSDETLYDMAKSEGGYMKRSGNVYLVFDSSGSHILAGRDGHAYAAYPPDGSSALGSDRETTTGHSTVTNNNTTQNITQDNSITNNNYDQSVNIEDQTQILPGGVQNVIDNVIYDDNTKTYYIDSHDTTNNVTNNYLYQYHINYTSITYIGQTEEYNKRYELYYQLPDGRDSADLTKEELEQLNVNIDVIPYVRSTDNIDVRSLYHFDADTRDSSYWNYITEFEWITGASLTYMESGAFDGALYLDENQHAFRLTMPQATDTAGDWTLQWRYYQSHTIAPVNDSSVYVGDKPVMTMDGQYFYAPSGAQIAVIPTGSWNEVCIIRSSGVLYYYVNGVYYTSEADANYRTESIRFIFGREQQTNKQLDELRFCRGALYTPGENYSPTSVPHDSNLTLILPTGKDVVVDEITTLIPGENNLMAAYNRHDWGSSKFTNLEGSQGDYTPFYSYSEYTSDYSPTGAWGSVYTGYPIMWDRSFLKWSKTPGVGSKITFGGTAFSMDSDQNSLYRQPKNALSLPLFVSAYTGDYDHFRAAKLVGDWQANQVYTYSVVLSDHSYSSVTFRINTLSDGRYAVEVLNVAQNSEIQFTFEEYGLADNSWDYEYEEYEYSIIYPLTCLVFNSLDGVATIAHTELVTGDAPEFEISFDTAIYDEGQLTHSPTLAVRTDVTITDYQIGGVRPSVPEKGQVWALVESGYITSLQVYTGSVWLNCDGRIWTGQRWIPASSYNVITLQDLFDIVDATQDYEYIYTESGFWSWLQNAWKDMLQRLDAILEGLEGKKGTSVDSCDHVYDLVEETESSCDTHARKTYSCPGCGDVYVELTDPLGHQWPVDPHTLTIVQQPQDVTAPVGSTATFVVVAVGDGLKYQWQFKRPTGSWQNSTTKGHDATYVANVTSSADGYQYRCRITDSSGNSVVSNIVMLTIGEGQQVAPHTPVIYSCSRCGVTGEVYDGGIVSSDGVPEDAFTFDDLLLESFDGIWTIVTGFVTTGYGGLSGFVDSFSLLPGFFHFYRPVSICGGGDIWD